MAKSPDAYRIAELEAKVARLEADFRRSADSMPQLDAPVSRLARTVVPDGGSYPLASANPTCYPIIFLDGTYTRTAGANAATWTDRQSQARDVAYNITSDEQSVYVPVGSIVAVFFKNNRWWTQWHAANIYHVIVGSTIVGGGSGSITLPDGRTVTATNQTMTTFNAADRATAYEDLSNQTWYLTGSGTGDSPDEMAIVTFYGGTANGNCLWPGKIANPNTSNTQCSDQFPNGSDCWIVVLNTNLGSVSTPKPAHLVVGHHYIGRHVCDFDNGDDTFTPIYAVRIEENEIYLVTIPTPGVESGDDIDIELEDGRTVSCLNASRVKCFTGSLAYVFHELSLDQWLLVPLDDIVRRRVQGLINMPTGLASTDGLATVDTIATLDGSSPAPTITFAFNTLKMRGSDNDVVILEEMQYAGGSSVWFVAAIQPQPGGSSIAEGLVAAAFTKSTIHFIALVTLDSDDPGRVDTLVFVKNQFKPNTGRYVFEGEVGAACKFYWDSASEVDRVIWVECPANSPVQVSPPPSPGEGFSMSGRSGNDPYSYGGI